MLFDTADNQSATEPSEPAKAVTTAPASTAQDATPTDQANAETTGAELENLEQTDPDEVEDELEGVKLKGKKDLLEKIKTERLLHGDYTRKTMTLAEKSRELEQRQEQFQQNAQLHQTFMREAAQMHQVEERLEQFQKLDWNALIAQDSTQAQKLQIEYTQLQALRGQLGNSLAQKQAQMQQAKQQETAKLARDAQTFLQREIKDWSPAKDAELEQYARGQGLNTQQLGQFLLHSPAIAVLIDKARQFDQLKKQAAAKPKAEPPKPVSRVGGGAASNTKSPSDMTPAEYAAWRQERKSKR
jgi:hypothetical protein